MHHYSEYMRRNTRDIRSAPKASNNNRANRFFAAQKGDLHFHFNDRVAPFEEEEEQSKWKERAKVLLLLNLLSTTEAPIGSRLMD